MHTQNGLLPKLTLAVLLLLLSACGSMPIASPPVAPPQVPKLPLAAQQPKPPALCSPTCSQGLTKLRESLQGTQTKPE